MTDKRAIRELKRVDREGLAPRERWRCEALEQADLIRFGSPRPGVSEFNCYRLTEAGRKMLGE